MAPTDILEQELHERSVEVVSPKPGVPVRREDLEDSVRDSEERDVEGAAAEIIDRDDPVLQPSKSVGEGRGSRLVEQPYHFEPGDLSRVARRLSLALVEVSRHRDHGSPDRLTEVSTRLLLERLEHDRRDLRRGDLTIADKKPSRPFPGKHREGQVSELGRRVVVAPPEQPLRGEDGGSRLLRE